MWQRTYWPDYDPSHPDADHGPEGNPDGDDFSNRVEYLYSYDPTAVTAEVLAILYVNIPPKKRVELTEERQVVIHYALNMEADVVITITKQYRPNDILFETSQAGVVPLNHVVWYGTDANGDPVNTGNYDITITATNPAGQAEWTTR